MKYSINNTELPNSSFLEGRAAEDDHIDIRVQPSYVPGEQMLYVDVNGITLVRIGAIKQEVEVTRS